MQHAGTPKNCSLQVQPKNNLKNGELAGKWLLGGQLSSFAECYSVKNKLDLVDL